MKRKKAGNLLSELNFISSLELEQSIPIITRLSKRYPVTLTERNPDRTDFEIKFRHGEVRGTLQRWRGNETRVTCSGDVVRILVPPKNDSDIIPSMLATGGLVGFILIAMGHPVPMMVMVGGMFVYIISQGQTHTRREPTTVALFRERDAIFQYLIDCFKAEGEVAPV